MEGRRGGEMWREIRGRRAEVTAEEVFLHFRILRPRSHLGSWVRAGIGVSPKGVPGVKTLYLGGPGGRSPIPRVKTVYLFMFVLFRSWVGNPCHSIRCALYDKNAVLSRGGLEAPRHVSPGRLESSHSHGLMRAQSEKCSHVT